MLRRSDVIFFELLTDCRVAATGCLVGTGLAIRIASRKRFWLEKTSASSR